MTYTIYDMDMDDLSRELVGKVVTSIDTDRSTLTLSDGTTLTFEDTSECCAWFCAELKAGNLTENAVTSIRATNNDPEAVEFDDENYTLHVLAVDHNICDISIEGTAESGYYCHSIDLTITEPRND